METIKVEIENKKDYNIFIGSSVLNQLPDYLKKSQADKKIVIITDDTIKRLYEKNIIKTLKDFNPYLISIPAGESSKNRETKQEIEDKVLEKKYGRDTVIIAFGGGVIGDIAGFVASTYGRGVPLIQIPTTLLAMVDSSVGGKTGVDTKYGKNLIGTIYQPDAVFTNLDFLENLPQEELLNGLAEIIKIAITSDKNLFEFIEKNHEKILKKDKEALTNIIKRSIELKRDIVEKDEKETGLRQTLNFGHTIGHAIEASSNYQLKHGFCVSIGMAVETRIAVLNNDLKQEEEKRIISILNKFNLPIKINKKFETNRLIDFMLSDKKARKHKPRFVILEDIGKIKKQNDNFSFEIKEEIMRKAVGECRND
jgi:3-dehydroquinate synthase